MSTARGSERWDGRLVLLTGATGYVGGRLLRALAGSPHTVRCLTRRPEALAGRLPPNAEVVRGDLADPESLRRAMEGVDVAYYLVHSMDASGDFVQREREAAAGFAVAAAEAGISRIVYLGALAHGEAGGSAHLESRRMVGEILRASGVPVIEFMASIVIGAGSLPFEVIRSLVERLPVMVTPRWVRMNIQPIASSDVVTYLAEALDLPEGGSAVYEIGGADVVTVSEVMSEYAAARGLMRLMIPVPVITPGLSGWWLHLVTPARSRVGRRIVDSVRHESVVVDHAAEAAFSVRPIGLRQAIHNALREEVDDVWNELGDPAPEDPGAEAHAVVRSKRGNIFVERRTMRAAGATRDAFTSIARIGGATGWYWGNFLWWLRGAMDRLVGGVGLRRGGERLGQLRVGDEIDFWRVEAVEDGRLLRMRAEMKLPGRAWLELRVSEGTSGTLVTQTVVFDPRGVLGVLYWYALGPLHGLVFDGMLRGIVRSAALRSIASSSAA